MMTPLTSLEILTLPEPQSLSNPRESQLGTVRKYLLTDDQGNDWLFKPQSDGQICVDVAASEISREARVLTPVVYAAEIMLNGKRCKGSLQPFLTEQHVEHWELPRNLEVLTDEQRSSLQCHHVVDWLLANADPHRGQFLLLRDGAVVAVDKSQALRFFPHDRLSWRAHAWWTNGRRPVYYILYEGTKGGIFELNPDHAIRFAAEVSQCISDEWLSNRWRPVLERWPPLRLYFAAFTSSIRNNLPSIQRVLSAIIRRKTNLQDDFVTLYFENSESTWLA